MFACKKCGCIQNVLCTQCMFVQNVCKHNLYPLNNFGCGIILII